MKKVLFIGMTDYKLETGDTALKKRFETMSLIFDVHVLARGRVWRQEKYNCRFYLTPKIIGLPLWLTVAFFRAWLIIRREKIDVVVSQSPTFDGLISVWLKLVTGCQLIIEAHGDWIESQFFYHQIKMERFFRSLLTRLGYYSLAHADKIRVISLATEAQAKKYAPDKPYYRFPAFFDVDLFLHETDSSWHQEILFAGALYRLKGVQFLLQAFSEIRTKFPEAKLVIAGDGPYLPELKQLRDDLHLERVEFIGQLYVNELKDRMKRCLVLVLPSLSEGLGRVLIEAQALGKPVIGSRVGGIPDIIVDGKNGFLFAPGNIFELAVHLDRLLSDEALAMQMGAEGKTMVKSKYSTQSFFDSYEKMVNDAPGKSTNCTNIK